MGLTPHRLPTTLGPVSPRDSRQSVAGLVQLNGGNEMSVDFGRLTQEETRALFVECAVYLPNLSLLDAISEITTRDDKDELMVRWEEDAATK